MYLACLTELFSVHLARGIVGSKMHLFVLPFIAEIIPILNDDAGIYSQLLTPLIPADTRCMPLEFQLLKLMLTGTR
mgnify:CR=1 FL=1